MSNYFIGGPLDGERHVVTRGDRMSMPAQVAFHQPPAVLISDKMARKDSYACRLPVEVVYRRDLFERDEDGAKQIVYIADGVRVTNDHKEAVFADIELDELEAVRRDVRGRGRR